MKLKDKFSYLQGSLPVLEVVLKEEHFLNMYRGMQFSQDSESLQFR